jgi:hypothetical protein
MAASLNSGQTRWRKVAARSWACFTMIWILFSGFVVVHFGLARGAQWLEIVSLREFWQVLIWPPFAAGLIAGAFALSVTLWGKLGVARDAQ